jgi:hypothetical protein
MDMATIMTIMTATTSINVFLSLNTGVRR